jgi:branched-chain amino acid transport system substrate-binding protein
MSMEAAVSKFDLSQRIGRRALLRAGAALGALPIAAPFIGKARGEVPVKIGFIDPFTGTYAALGDSELKGARMAIAEINKKGGILGREVVIIPEDSAADVGTATVKFHKVVDQDRVDFVAGSVSSAVSLALSHAANLKGILYMDTGGHVDTVTGTHCHWTTFKVCSDTWMLANALAKTLLKFGKRWYISTPDYAWGHFLEAGFAKILSNCSTHPSSLWPGSGPREWCAPIMLTRGTVRCPTTA